jgi:hypothetical protein
LLGLRSHCALPAKVTPAEHQNETIVTKNVAMT